MIHIYSLITEFLFLEPADQRFSFDGKLCPPPKCDPGLTPIETEVETLYLTRNSMEISFVPEFITL